MIKSYDKYWIYGFTIYKKFKSQVFFTLLFYFDGIIIILDEKRH